MASSSLFDRVYPRSSTDGEVCTLEAIYRNDIIITQSISADTCLVVWAVCPSYQIDQTLNLSRLGMTMSLSDNKSIAARYLTAWAVNDHVAMDALCAESVHARYTLTSDPVRGRIALKALLDQIHNMFPNLTVEMHQIVAEGEYVAIRWTMHGTHHETSASWPGQSMLRIVDGTIVEDFGVDDGLGMLRQLGVREVPQTKP